MASRTLKVEIVGDASSFQRALNNASGTSGKFGGTIARMGKLAAAGMAAIGVGAVIAGKRMVSMASDAAEVDSKLDVVFGKALPKLTKNLDTFAEATGASRFQLREQAADMGALLVPLSSTVKGAADMSEQFVKLATDLGSFNNVPVEEALLAIRSGLVGEAEPLRRFGVLLNEAAVKAEAYSSGIAKTGEELTEQQKVQARANLIMEQTTLAQEDATRTAGLAANQFKALRNNISDAATEMGAKLLPAVLAAVDAFNDNWPQIEKVVDTVMDGIATAVEAGVNAIRTHFGTIKTIATTAFSGAISAVRELADFFGSELGRKLAIGATGFLAVSKAMGGILAAAKLANTGLLLVKANPLWAALIPLGFALGAVAEQFIKSKIEAANAAAAWDAALDASNRLASALSGVKGAQIEVRQATLDARSAHAEHVKSIDASKDALLRYGPQSAQYRGALTAEEQAAINSDRATLRLKDSKEALNQKTGETETISKSASQAILSMAGSMDKASGSSIKSAQLTGLQSKEADAYVKKLGELIPKQEAMAAKYRASEPALANQATKTAELARKLSELAKETGKVPDRKTIIAEAKLIGGPAFSKAVAGIIEGSDNAQKGAKKELDKLPGHVDSAIAAGNREAAGASVIAGTITSGIESGFNFGGIINIVRSGVRAAIAAGANAGSTTKEYAAKEIGKPLSEGPIEQVKKDAPKLAEVTAASVRAAVGAAQLAAAKHEIGAKAVQKIIDDIVGKTPGAKALFAQKVAEIAEAGRQAIADARQGYADAFAGLFQAGADAIAAKYAGWQPPSLLKAQREAEAREKAQLLADIDAAQKALAAAMAAGQALPPLKMGEVPTEEFKKAEADILAAQKSLDDLLFQQRQKKLADDAIQEEKDHNAMIAREQKKFGAQLAIIQGQYAKHKITYDQLQAKIRALLDSYNIDFKNAGNAWGNSLAEGIRAAKQEVKNAAQELATIAKNNLQNNSPKPKEGPLSKKSMFDAGREHGMNWAAGIASAMGAAKSAAATTAGGASGGFGDAKNTGNIFDFGSGTPPPGGFGPDFEGSRPSWADRELWETTAVMAAKLGKFDALIDAVQSGSIKANAGLLSQLFYARTRKTWNDFPARIAKILDDMRGPEGLSSAEAAAKYGLKKGGYVKQDGFAFLHKNEIVTPLPSSGRMSMGSQAININFNGTVMGGTEAQMARVLAPAIENEIRRSQRRGNASIVQAT